MGKRMKKLALLLSVSMLVNSIDTAAIVGAADMTEVMEDSEMAMEETVEEQESGEIPVYEELSVEEGGQQEEELITRDITQQEEEIITEENNPQEEEIIIEENDAKSEDWENVIEENESLELDDENFSEETEYEENGIEIGSEQSSSDEEELNNEIEAQEEGNKEEYLEEIEDQSKQILTEDSTEAEESDLQEEIVFDNESENVEIENETEFTESLEKNEIAIQSSVVASGECGENVNWSLSADGTLTISGTGEMKDYGAPNSANSSTTGGPTPWRKTYNHLIKRIVVEEGITRIGKGAFVCAGTTVTDFDAIGSVQSITLPSTLKSIGWHAFWNTECNSLIIPENITEAGLAFKMARFETVIVNTPKVPKEMFEESLIDDIVLSNNVKEIERYAFSSSNIKSIKFSSGVNKIGEHAFWGCKKLVTLEIPGNVKTIERAAFMGCISLKELKLSNGIESIGQEAFYGCENLKEITIPESVNKMTGSCFERCTNLQTAIINANVEGMGSGTYVNCTELQTVVLPESLTYIGAGMFYGCKKLSAIQIPSNVKNIYSDAFGKCESLTEITIPASVEYIARGMGGKLNEFNAFIDCNNLMKINVDAGNKVYTSYDGCLYTKDLTELVYCPMGKEETVIASTVSKMQNSTFYNSNNSSGNLKRIYFTGNAPEMSEYLFLDITATVFVPNGNTTWSNDNRKNYNGQITWREWQPLIDQCTIKLSQSEYSFDGQEKRPSITVTGGDIVLNENQDYTLSYNNNINAGNATVTVTGKGKYTGKKSFTYVIKKVEQKLTTSISKTSLQIGEKIPITASAIGKISYSSNRADIVSVDANGYITGKKAGTAVICIVAAENTNYKSTKKELTITVKNECKDNIHKWGNYKVTQEATVLANGIKIRTCSVCGQTERSIIPKLKGTIQLTMNTVTLKSKGTIQLSGMVSDIEKGDYIKSYVSDNTKIATVNQQGLVTAKTAGKANIKITLASGVTATVKIRVQPAKIATTKLQVASSVKLTVGQKKKLAVTVTPKNTTDKVTYVSANKSIATVSSNGTITAKKSGKTKITVKSGSKKATVTITVVPKAPTGIKGIPTKQTLKKGKTFVLKAKLVPIGAEAKITYKSSNTKVATVDAKGNVKAKKVGTAVITVTAGKAKTTCKITVK